MLFTHVECVKISNGKEEEEKKEKQNEKNTINYKYKKNILSWIFP